MGTELWQLWLGMCSVFVGKSSLCPRGVSACSPRCPVQRLQRGSSALQGALVAALSCVRCVSVGRAVLLGEQGGTWIPAMQCWVGRAGQGNINSPAWLCARVGLIRTGAARLYIERRRGRFQTHTLMGQTQRPDLDCLGFGSVLLKRECGKVHELRGLRRSTGQGPQSIETRCLQATAFLHCPN